MPGCEAGQAITTELPLSSTVLQLFPLAAAELRPTVGLPTPDGAGGRTAGAGREVGVAVELAGQGTERVTQYVKPDSSALRSGHSTGPRRGTRLIKLSLGRFPKPCLHKATACRFA